MMNTCPVCESDQLKKATLVHAEGVATTVGVGGAIGPGGLGVGVGRGVSTSALAAKCAPPKKVVPSPFGDAKMWQFLLVFIPFLFAFAGQGDMSGISYFWLAWGVVGGLFLSSKGWRAAEKAEAEHRQAVIDYENTYMCLRCGHLFQPFER